MTRRRWWARLRRGLIVGSLVGAAWTATGVAAIAYWLDCDDDMPDVFG